MELAIQVQTLDEADGISFCANAFGERHESICSHLPAMVNTQADWAIYSLG